MTTAPSGARKRAMLIEVAAQPFLRAAVAAWSPVAALVARHKLRAEIVRQLPIVDGERVLGVFCAEKARCEVAATDRALYRQCEHVWVRTGWEQVVHIGGGAGQTLNLAVLLPDGRRTAVELPVTGSVAELVRERVDSTMLISRRVLLADQDGATVLARRPPGADEAVWQILLDDRLDPADPAVRAKVTAVIDSLRTHL